MVEEKISLTAGRDGGLQNMEVHGMMRLKINDEKASCILVKVINNDNKGIQLQVRLDPTWCLIYIQTVTFDGVLVKSR